MKPRWFLLSALVHAAVAANLGFLAGEGCYTPLPAQEIAVELVAPDPAAEKAPARREPAAPIRELRAPAATVRLPVPATVPSPRLPAAVSPTAPSRAAGPPPETRPLQVGAGDLQFRAQHEDELPPRAVLVAAGGGRAGVPEGAPPRPGSTGDAAPRQQDDAASRRTYLSACRLLIERHKEYPLMARKGRVEGTVVVAAALARDGALVGCRVAVSSGSLLLDNAALRSVRSVSRFPPLPEGTGDLLDFSVPVSFRLSSP